MRSFQQKKVLELIQTLYEANLEIKQLFSKKDSSAMIQLLSDCQDFVETIEGFIFEIEGDGTQTSVLLSELYDMLYDAGMAVNNEKFDNNFIRTLKKQLDKIKNCVKTELKPDKIEVAFFPYKYSMFDALESIWIEANNDPNCDAYVVPIPYFEFSEGRNVGEMQYEGELYPKDIPIVNWQEYNAEQRHPDIIYIHYPYDGTNNVTIIPPSFHSKTLKDFTDLLVYVPYFVCIDDVKENLCVCPATIHSDRIVVQSEKVRQTYIRVFKEFEKENNIEGKLGKIENKVVALGSPKIDKVINSKTEDFEIPENWNRIIYRPDGSRKKIILYNTTIAAILTDNENTLLKLKFVFDTFKQYDDVVLLWRPHPLNLATYEAMRPQFAQEYKQIVDKYIDEGWGIYDDTADLHRAISISDSYYGDMGSMVALFHIAGKPIMVQNVKDIHVHDEKHKFACTSIFNDDNDNLWFTEGQFNGLFKMDKKTGEIECIGSFPDENNINHLFMRFVRNGKKIYFAPFNAENIAIFDIENQTFLNISFNSDKPLRTDLFPEADFVDIVSYKNSVYYIPYFSEFIMELDTITNEIRYYSDWIEPLDQLLIDGNLPFSYKACQVNEKIMIASCNANAVIEFNMETKKSNVYEVGKENYRYTGICFDGENYWLSPLCNTSIVKWHPEKGIINEFIENYCNGDNEEWLYFPPIYSENFVWLIPMLAKSAFKINVKTDEISIAEEFDARDYDYDTGQLYWYVQNIDDIIYANCGYEGILIEYNCKTGERREIATEYSFKNFQECTPMMEFYSKRLTRNPENWDSVYSCYFYENDYHTLNNFILSTVKSSSFIENNIICDEQIDMFKKFNNNADGTAGDAIYRYCRKKLRLE